MQQVPRPRNGVGESMKDWMIRELQRTFDAYEVIDCGDVTVVLRIPGTASDKTKEKIREIARSILKSKGLEPEEAFRLELLEY
jgi:hypothetical protein